MHINDIIVKKTNKKNTKRFSVQSIFVLCANNFVARKT